MYKLTLPPNCPLGGAEERDVALYRILHGSTMTDDDLRSHVELYPYNRYTELCKASGISLYENRDAAIRACQEAKKRNRVLGAYVGKVQIKTQHGRLHCGKRGHCTLWLYDQVDASKITCRDIVKVEV